MCFTDFVYARATFVHTALSGLAPAAHELEHFNDLENLAMDIDDGMLKIKHMHNPSQYKLQ